MSLLEALGILAAGGAAGAINVIVGSGTLITFPVLLAFGYAPVVANVSNTIGLVPGSVAGAIGYRRELARPAPANCEARVRVRLGCGDRGDPAADAAALRVQVDRARVHRARAGADRGAARLTSILRRRDADAQERLGPAALLAVFATGVYGGYFGAAQGILLLSILGLALHDTLQRINATKNVLAGLVNLLAGVIFAAVAHVSWPAVGLIAAGSVIGGTLGGRYGRRLPPAALRAIIVAVGIVAIVRLL